MSWKWVQKLKNDISGEYIYGVPAIIITDDIIRNSGTSTYRIGGTKETGKFDEAYSVIVDLAVQGATRIDLLRNNYDVFFYGLVGGTGLEHKINISSNGAFVFEPYKWTSFNAKTRLSNLSGGFTEDTDKSKNVWYLAMLMNDETEYAYLCAIHGSIYYPYYPEYFRTDSAYVDIYFFNAGMLIQPSHNLYTIIRGSIPSGGGNPYEGGGYSDVTGETGEFDEESEIVAEPQTPVSLAISSGFLTVYNPSYTQVVELGNYLWTSLDLNSLKKLFGNPMDCIIGVSIYPFQIPNEADDYYIMVGNVNTLVKAKKALGQFVTIDCGKLYIKPYSMSYLDFSPFTKIELVLPYIGSYQLDTDIIMGKWIKLNYKVDLLSGACLASLSYSDSENGEYSVISEYTGKCNVDIPLVATDFRNMQGALLGAVSSFQDYISSNGASGFSPLQSGVASTVAMMKPNVNRSGALQSCIGYLGVQKPRIIKTIPRQCVAENQGYMEGFPSFIKANVGELSGFTVFEDVEIKCNAMTEKERKRAIALLEKGVWL